VKRAHPNGGLLGWVAIALFPLLLFIADVRHAVESRMLLHMMLEFPLLMISGWASHQMVARVGPASAVRTLAFIDWQGWAGATLALGMAMAWMIPSALDAALLSAPVAAIKFASWWLAGAVLAGSWQRWSPELLLFVAGNLTWMMATAGALYIDAPQRLCASYLLNEQRHTGIALIAAALAIGVLATVRAATSSAITRASSVSSTTPTSLLSPSVHAARQLAGESDRRRACVAPRPES
jgi:hypothetical protein